jgi:hypothetical protein
MRLSSNILSQRFTQDPTVLGSNLSLSTLPGYTDYSSIQSSLSEVNENQALIDDESNRFLIKRKGTLHELIVESTGRVSLREAGKYSGSPVVSDSIARTITQIQVNMTATTTQVLNESLTGNCDGANNTFLLPANYVSGTLKLFRSGVRQNILTDYIISGITVTMLSGSIPETEDTLRGDYETSL